MSGTTTSPILVAPYDASMPNVADGGLAWVFGPWVELVTATGGPTAIAGLSIGEGGGYSQLECEVDIGIGALGHEVSIGVVRLFGPDSGNTACGIYMLRVPISGIPSGSRIALRRRQGSPTTPIPMGLLYYENFDGDLYTTDTITCSPLASGSTVITPNASAWVNSAWFELVPEVTAGRQALLVGLALSDPYTTVDVEYDLGVGGVGSEVVISTFRSSMMVNSSGRLWFLTLPALYPVDASSRIVVRMRKSGTSTTGQKVDLLYFDSAVTPPTPTPTAIPIVTTGQWMLQRFDAKPQKGQLA